MNGRLHLWWRFPLVFSGLLACLAVLLWMGWRAYDGLLDAQRARMQSEQVLATLSRLERHAVPDGGLALCASVGAPVGPPHDPALADARPALNALRGLFANNRSQTERLSTLTDALAEWELGYTKPLVKSCADGVRLGAAYVQSLLRVATPTQQLIRTEIEALRRTETGLQAEREAHLHASVQWTTQLLAMAAGASLLLGVAAVMAMRGFAGQLSEGERRLRREFVRCGVAEEQLGNFQRRLRMVLEHSTDAVIGFDRVGKVQWMNPAAEVMFHRARQAVAGGAIWDLIPSLRDDLDWPVTRPQAESEGMTPVPWTTRREVTEGARPGGALFPIDVAMVQTRLDGDRLGICIVHDQTEAERVRALKGEFVALIGQEMRTPLARMQASLAAIGEVPVLQASVRQQLTLARGDGDRLMALLDDVLQYEQLRSGDLLPRLEPVDLVLLAREALATLEPRAERQRVVLLPQWEAASLPVLGDARQLAQVLVRLLADAIDASPVGGDVQLVASATPQGEARVAVIDSGPRPTAEFIERAFDAFTVIDQEGLRVRGGNGLTLALCRGMLEQIGARVGVEPVPLDRGASLWFSLPLRSVAQEARAQAAVARRRARS